MFLPSLSVVLPNYNDAKYLPHALEAIFNQSVKPQQIIIIDDGSTDNSVEVISGFIKQDPSVEFILNEKNLGVFINIIKGLEKATCDYIYFADSGDYMLPGFIEKSLKLLAKHPQAGFCSSLSRRFNESGDYIDTVPEPPYSANYSHYVSAQEIQNNMMNKNNWDFTPPTIVFNRKLIDETKAFTLDSGRYIDGFATLLMSLQYGACFIPEELHVQVLKPNSISADSDVYPESHLRDVTPTWKLMETAYADKFPPKIRNVVKRRHLYLYGAIVLNQARKSHEDFLEGLKVSLDRLNLIDHLYFLSIRIFSRVQFLTTKLYLFLRLRNISYDIIIRVINRLKNRILPSKEETKRKLKLSK